MGHYLSAVLVPAHATVTTADPVPAATPPRLALLVEHLLTGRRRLPGHSGPFTAVDWSVAIVDTHR
jgi:hypothetical protein